MLMQNFKSAAALGLTEQQKDALCKVLVLLETDKLTHTEDYHLTGGFDEHPKFTGHFNMDSWGNYEHNCGTVACIGGTAEILAGDSIFYNGNVLTGALQTLFYPDIDADWVKITTSQAATALRSYLTTGDPKWAEAVA